MMRYNEFVEVFRSKLLESLPDEFSDWKFKVVKVPKVNKVTEEFTLKPPITNSATIPVLPLAELYQRYQGGVPLDDLVKECLSVLLRNTTKIQLPKNKDDFLQIVIPTLVKRDWNLEMLQKVPHRNFLDLAIIYRGILSVNSKEIKDFLVTKSLVNKFGVSEEELYSAAIENLKDWKCEWKTLESMLSGLTGGRVEIPEMPVLMFVLTNKYRMLGSHCLLQNDVLADIAAELKNDLVLLPSSIHEILIVPYEGDGMDEFDRMVCDVNATELEEQNRLSDHVYIYSRKEKRVMEGNVYAESQCF